ncbi:hypothetical protein [uncultured Winogradskyella sp.]|uniref:hypothetical protein n=1 Tax=uncultured Winogradskyella sp. TaxID=395353 RepID=UPI0030DCB071|tara:strand:+ start:31179 stop:31550 length:372 start_codon:yes stop_codon:yes gene_type:complete
MKLKLFYVILLLCFCCDETSKKQSIKTSIGDLTNKKPSVFLEECIFDQATQTDEFLKEIDELEGYVWNTETKTAEITLYDHWFLTIRRDDFNYHANLIDKKLYEYYYFNNKTTTTFDIGYYYN